MATGLTIPFFGRGEELKQLSARTTHPGLTVVQGPPQIGKTRLLREFRDRTRAAGACRIGYAEASETAGDVLLRATADAYQDWLSKAGAWGELRSLHERYKETFVGRVGPAIGRLLAAGGGLPTSVAQLFDAIFSGLQKANEAVRTGGVEPERLTSEEARGLLRIIAHDQKRPVVLVLNQWEDGGDLEHDAATLRDFLRGLHEWPSTHVLLHLRDPRQTADRNQNAGRLAGNLLQLSSATALLEVPCIPFRTDAEARRSLLDWLLTHFPGVKSMTESERLDCIGGHPGVLERWSWLREEDRGSVDRLREEADAAHQYRHPEIERIFDRLHADAMSSGSRKGILHLALRLAIAPPIVSPADWQSVRSAMLAGAPPDALTDLESGFDESGGLVRPQDGCPSLGHPLRHAAARRLVLGEAQAGLASQSGRLRPHARQAMEDLALALVERFTPEDWLALVGRMHPAARMLAAIEDSLQKLDAGPAAQAVSLAAESLLGPDGARRIHPGTMAASSSSSRSTAVLIAMGLFNAICDSKPNSARADRLLDEVRSLAADHPDEPALREPLAMGLFNAFHDSEPDSERADRLLGELRSLATDHPDEPALREELSKGLINATAHSGVEALRADRLLDEMRSLAASDPDEPALREFLAKGLFNTFHRSGPPSERSDRLLDELRSLALNNPDEPVLREQLARGMYNALYGSEPNSERGDHFLDELRSLAFNNPDEPLLREQLARGLTNATAHSSTDTTRVDRLLDVLRSLAAAHPGEPALREQLAMGLFNAFNGSEPDSERADRLLDELRLLGATHPKDEPAAGTLLRALALTMALHRPAPPGLCELVKEATGVLRTCPSDLETKGAAELIVRTAGQAAQDCGGEDREAIERVTEEFRQVMDRHWREAV